MLLLQATEGTTYLIAMTLSVLEYRFPIASLYSTCAIFLYFIHLTLPFLLP